MKRSKVYQTAVQDVPKTSLDLVSAVAWLKSHTRPNFDETIELHFNLGIDPSKSDQHVRGAASLPAGAPKQKRVVVFTSDPDQAQAALEAGAHLAGGEELIKQIATEGTLAADLTIATPELMPKIASIAKVLGPAGLMPNPKTGTVSADPISVLKELSEGKLSFKMDKLGNLHEAIAKASWEDEKIINNASELIKAVQAARPSAAKGEFIKSATLTSTMSPGIRLSLSN